MKKGFAMMLKAWIMPATVAASALLGYEALHAFEVPATVIEEKCAADWPHNDRMRLACIEQQERVLKKSQSNSLNPVLPIEDHTLVREKCAKDWPDDFRMRGRCEQQQIGGYQKLQAPPPKDVTLRDYSVAMAQCVKDWPDDFRLRARCLEEQLAAARMHDEANHESEMK